MADELTPREIAREFDRIAQQQKDQDDRINQLALNTASSREITELRADLTRTDQVLTDGLREARSDLRREIDAVDARSRDRYDRVLALIDAVGKRIDGVMTTIEQRTQFSRQSIIAIVAIIVTLVTSLLTILASSKGITL